MTILRGCLLLLAASAWSCGARSELDGPAPEAGPPEAGVADAATPPGCGPADCAGCCDEAGTCQPGNDVAICGEMGRSCQGCDPRFELCHPDPANPDGEVCFSPCDFRGCSNGCCLANGVCVNGDDDSACGGAGQLCQDCSAAGQVCEASGGEPARVCMGK